jgi:hypothetical protein
VKSAAFKLVVVATSRLLNFRGMDVCVFFDEWVVCQGLGSVAFLPALSTFPVRYVDKEVAVFDFKVTGSCIVAAKVLSS